MAQLRKDTDKMRGSWCSQNFWHELTSVLHRKAIKVTRGVLLCLLVTPETDSVGGQSSILPLCIHQGVQNHCCKCYRYKYILL